MDYRTAGYLPEALNNFLALLGWNDGTRQEIFAMDELVAKFSLGRILKSPAKFDAERLDWINAQHLRKLPLHQLSQQATDFWPPEANQADAELKGRILEIEQERIKTLGEIKELPNYFFAAPKLGSKLATLKADFEQAVEDDSLTGWLREVVDLINAVGDSDPQALESTLRSHVQAHQGQPGILFSALRIVLTGAAQPPPIWDLIYILGKAESISRLKAVLDQL